MSDSIMTTEAIQAALLEKMKLEDDIKRVIHLVPHGDRFRYLIETPFQTFPKFVIGTTDADFNDVRIESRCGLISTAEIAWELPNHIPKSSPQ